MRGFKVRAWDDVLGEMLYSNPEQFDDGLMLRFEKHFETEQPVYMQYTGLKDRNGKEIYEGDIVPHPGGFITQVEFHNGTFILRSIGYGSIYCLNHEHVEVIGNIYEKSRFFVRAKAPPNRPNNPA